MGCWKLRWASTRGRIASETIKLLFGGLVLCSALPGCKSSGPTETSRAQVRRQLAQIARASECTSTPHVEVDLGAVGAADDMHRYVNSRLAAMVKCSFKAKTFTVHWNYSILNSHDWLTYIYDRPKRTFTVTNRGALRSQRTGNSVYHKTYRHVTDADILKAGRTGYSLDFLLERTRGATRRP